MRAELVGREVIVTTANRTYLVSAYDDIAVKSMLDTINRENPPSFQRFIEGVLASFGDGDFVFSARDVIARLSRAAETELLTGKRDPVLYGENIIALPPQCSCCLKPAPPGMAGTLCDQCKKALEVD